MVAVPEMPASAPVARADTGRSTVPAHGRRMVAVSVSAMELLRPESDLARLAEGFPHVDLLVAADDQPPSTGAVGVLRHVDHFGDEVDDPTDPVIDGIQDGVTRLGLPGLHLHRLGLRLPLSPLTEGDLVAALSELVGFDPEPGVYCLSPASGQADHNRTVVNRAAQRIAQVYGLPLLRYRCLELSVVGEDGPGL